MTTQGIALLVAPLALGSLIGIMNIRYQWPFVTNIKAPFGKAFDSSKHRTGRFSRFLLTPTLQMCYFLAGVSFGLKNENLKDTVRVIAILYTISLVIWLCLFAVAMLIGLAALAAFCWLLAGLIRIIRYNDDGGW